MSGHHSWKDIRYEMPTLECVICGNRPVHAAPWSDQPYGATIFTTHGHHGSTVFDEADGRSTLEVSICDRHILDLAREGRVRHRVVVRHEKPVTETRPWPPAQLTWCEPCGRGMWLEDDEQHEHDE